MANNANPQQIEHGTAKFIGNTATKIMNVNETNILVKKLLKVENHTSLLSTHSDS